MLSSCSPSSLSLNQTIGVSMLSAIVPAIATACGGYVLARNHDRTEREQWLRQARSVAESQITTLRETYITPLRYWASLLMKRMKELENKHNSGEYGQVGEWLQQVKNHADGTGSIDNFPFWSSYVGVFAITTLYWTCEYLRTAREVRFGSPFNSIDREYDTELQFHLVQVSEAFGGIWDSAQEVIAEATSNRGHPWNYQDLCRLIDSRDRFSVAPLLRPLDYYIHDFGARESKTIHDALEGLVNFVDSRPTPRRLSG
jgi:hypothetical protein